MQKGILNGENISHIYDVDKNECSGSQSNMVYMQTEKIDVHRPTQYNSLNPTHAIFINIFS